MRLWIKVLLLSLLSVMVLNAQTDRAFREQDSSLKSEEIATLHIGKKYAVIIGINSYKNGINPLKTAVNDAKAVEKILKEVYGFETILITDNLATKDYILETIESIAKKVKANDQMLIYYGGHGYFEKQTDTAYWIPSDAKSDSFVKGIKSKDISDLLKMSESKQVLIVSDSCYSGTMDRDNSIQWKSQSDTRASFLQKQLYEKSRVLLSSGGNEPVSDGYGEHSIFAKYFIKKLKEFEKDIFTAEELYISYKEPISGNSSQTPEYKGITASGHESGDFVFVKKVIKQLTQQVQNVEQVIKPVEQITKPIVQESKITNFIEAPKDVVIVDGLWYQNQPFTEEYELKEAREYCNNLTLAEKSDWRLPTQEELKKLGTQSKNTNLKGYTYYIDSRFVEHMPRPSNGKYNIVFFWTSTEFSKDSEGTWMVNFGNGSDSWGFDMLEGYTLCVRGE